MEQIQRYRLSRCGVHLDPRPCICGKLPDSSGDLVLEADHAAAMDAKDDTIKQLRQQLHSAKQQLKGCAIAQDSARSGQQQIKELQDRLASILRVSSMEHEAQDLLRQQLDTALGLPKVDPARVDHNNFGANDLMEKVRSLNAQLSAAQQQIKTLREALEFIANLEDFTFAECSLAEEIIGRAKSALADSYRRFAGGH